MKRFASFMFAGLLACISGLVGVSAAQEVPQNPEEATEGTADAPAGEPVPFSDEPSLLYATELMQRGEVYARSIAELSEVPEVEVRQLSALPRSDASAAVIDDTVDRFLTYSRDDIAALRSAMGGNAVVAEAIESAGVELSDVVAAEIRPDLALRVFVLD